jgi:hypothetical protein
MSTTMQNPIASMLSNVQVEALEKLEEQLFQSERSAAHSLISATFRDYNFYSPEDIYLSFHRDPATKAVKYTFGTDSSVPHIGVYKKLGSPHGWDAASFWQLMPASYSLLMDHNMLGLVPEILANIHPETVKGNKCIAEYEEYIASLDDFDEEIAAYNAELDYYDSLEAVNLDVVPF